VQLISLSTDGEFYYDFKNHGFKGQHLAKSLFLGGGGSIVSLRNIPIFETSITFLHPT
jgi:hypothetical protein